MGAYVRFEDVWTTLGSQEVHRGLSFQAERGEVVALLGPSGCGKTTALRILAGLITRYRGRVEVDGLPPQEAWPRMALVFQSPRLVPWRTALENVALGLELRFGWRRSPRVKARCQEYLEAVGLGGDGHKYPHALSGGERHRVALARAFATEAELLLMDEPFSDLDVATRNRLWDLTLGLCRRHGRTVIMVTHNLEEAVYLADRVFVLSNKPSATLATVRVEAPHPRQPQGDPRLQEARLRLQRVIQEAGAGREAVPAGEGGR